MSVRGIARLTITPIWSLNQSTGPGEQGLQSHCQTVAPCDKRQRKLLWGTIASPVSSLAIPGRDCRAAHETEGVVLGDDTTGELIFNERSRHQKVAAHT